MGVIPHDICDNFFYVTDDDGNDYYNHGDINDKHVCVATYNTRDTCNADEGGPLIVDNGRGQYILVGVLILKFIVVRSPKMVLPCRLIRHLSVLIDIGVPAALEVK